jgi:DNA-directed RNA polymerase specialized sigma24 family protein
MASPVSLLYPAAPALAGDRAGELRRYAEVHHDELRRLAYLLAGDWSRAGTLVERALADGYRQGQLDHREVRSRLVRLALRDRGPQPEPGGDPLWAAVRGLPPKQRAALVLWLHAGLPTSEIADLMDRSEPAVARLLMRARQTLGSVALAPPKAGA